MAWNVRTRMTFHFHPTLPYLHHPLMNPPCWSCSRRLSSPSVSLQVVRCPLVRSWVLLHCAWSQRRIQERLSLKMFFFWRSPHHRCLLFEVKCCRRWRPTRERRGTLNCCFESMLFVIIQNQITAGRYRARTKVMWCPFSLLPVCCQLWILHPVAKWKHFT